MKSNLDIERFSFTSNIGMAERIAFDKKKEFFNVFELLNFINLNISKNMLSKSIKFNLSAGDLCYSFYFKNTDEFNKKKEKLVVIIPKNLINSYSAEITKLNFLVEKQVRIKKSNSKRIKAWIATGIVLMSFATVKLAQISEEEHNAREEYLNEYYDEMDIKGRNVSSSNTLSEKEKLEEIKQRALNGDQSAIEEYNEYIADAVKNKKIKS